MLGLKRPSIRSTWLPSAPPASPARPSSARRPQSAETTVRVLRRGGTATILGMMPLNEKVGLSAMDLLSGKRLQGGIMGYNRFPVDIPRLVDFYQRGQLDLDTIIAERLPLTRINDAFDELRKGDATRSVIVFDQ